MAAIVLPRWGHVVPSEGVVAWLVVDDGGVPVEPIRVFLRDFVARGNRPGSVRSYAYALLRWWRWLRVVGRGVGQGDLGRGAGPGAVAGPGGARTATRLGRRRRRRPGRSTWSRASGTWTTGTGRARCGTATRSCAASTSIWIELGEGPLVNPVALQRARGGRPNAHHNPMQPFRPEGRIRYNPKLPKRRPRAMTDEQWLDLFAALRSNRDRALLALAVSNAARAGELLGIRCCRPGLGRPAGAGQAQGQRRGAVATGQPGGVRVAAALPRRRRRLSARTRRCGGRSVAATTARAWRASR